MKRSILSPIIAAVAGFGIAWFAKGPAAPHLGTDPTADGTARSRTRTTRDSGQSSVIPRWMPRDERAFLDPRTETDHAEVQRLVRIGLEGELVFHRRIKAISDLMELMTPENARDIRDAFENSAKDGFDYNTERGVFLSRYAELMGREAAEYFKNDKSLKSLVVAWALTAPKDAIAWVNEMPPGKQRDAVINRLIGQMGPADTTYAMEIFESLDPRDQALNQRAIVEAYLRSGGREACHALAQDLLGRTDESLQAAGRHALQRTFDLYDNPEELNAWLISLPREQIRFLNQSRLPDEFKAEPAGAVPSEE